MKFVVAIFALALSPLASASAPNCDGLPEKVESQYVYAEVFSRGHMDLELVAIQKIVSNTSFKIVKVEPSRVLICNPQMTSSVPFNGTVAVDSTHGGSSRFTASYAICIFDWRGNFIESHAVCNSEVGD